MNNWRESTRKELILFDALLKDPELAMLEREKCRRDPWHWLTRWAWTLDTHDESEPVKRFPSKPYVKEIVTHFQREQLILIPKSRQMMITWLMVALFLHNAQFNPGRYIFFQSKKEKDACDLVERAGFIFENQPRFLKQPVSLRSGEILFRENSSRIRGIPQGGDQIRMHTASGIFMDEAGFMYEAEESYMSAKPSIDGGGKIVMASSANPGFFEKLVSDKI